MKRYTVYQQLPPYELAGDGIKEWGANFCNVGWIDAETGAKAIDKARRFPCFAIARGLAKFPVVQEQMSAISAIRSVA